MELRDYGKPATARKQQNLQKDPPDCAENAKHYFVNFCDRTGLHGFNLLVEKKRTVPERIWWAIIIIAAFSLCIAMVVQTTKKWINFPVTVTFATSQTHIHDVPFPAVTICPETKSQSDIYNYTKLFLQNSNEKELSPEEAKAFEYLSIVCDAPEEFLNMSQEFIDEDVVDFLQRLAPDFTSTFFKVEWLGNKYDDDELNDLFSPVLTSEGVCYTFNIMDRSEIFTDVVSPHKDFFSTNGKTSDWSLDQGYSKNSKIESYPRRTLAAGIERGLTIILRASHSDLDYACGDSLQGFKVMLHNPASTPRAKQDYFRVPLDHSIVAAIKPRITTTSEDLIPYTPEERQCYFASEKSLKFYKIYNQANCLNECLLNFTLVNCGCVGFHMARENSTPICGPPKIQCMEDAKVIFVESKVRYRNGKAHQQSVVEKCSCLPSCTSLDFGIELSQSDWEWKERMHIESLTPKWNPLLDLLIQDSHFSCLQVFYKDMQFITSERNELYSQIDFWANIGGVLGLFTGFTFISGCEVLYYLTLRLGCNLRKFGRNYWSGSEELLSEKENKNDD